MQAPRPWDWGNWVCMVGVGAPLPPPKQRPPPRQAVRDRNTNPSWSLLWFTAKAYSITGMLYVFFLYWPADYTKSWGPCACECCLHLPRSISVPFIYIYIQSTKPTLTWKIADCVSLISLISNAAASIHMSLLDWLCLHSGVTNTVACLVASRQPEAAQLIHSQLPDLPLLWSCVPLHGLPASLYACLQQLDAFSLYYILWRPLFVWHWLIRQRCLFCLFKVQRV